jgi:hypothetical protein
MAKFTQDDLVATTIYTMDGSHSHTFTIPDTITPSDVVIRAENGRVIVDGDFQVGRNGEILEDRLSRIEKVLGITPRLPGLEDKYPDLQEIGQKMDDAIATLNKTYAEAISNVVGSYKDFANQCEVMEKLKSNNGSVR